jgi:hypothetical protein
MPSKSGWTESQRESSPSAREHLHASMALLAVDPPQIDYLTDRLLSASPGHCLDAQTGG